MRNSLKWAAVFALAVVPLGCNDTASTTRTTKHTTTTTTTRETPPPASDANVGVNAGPNGATATGRTAANGGGAADVNVTPGGGVNVNVDGEPIRDRIRERRAARDAALPR
ncbi:MAG: hypothetical protein ACREHD_20995 [Pirellulales bacterium]